MKLIKMDPFPPNSNPFLHDEYHMGQKVGSNCYIMFENFEKDVCNYLIIVDTKTGERQRLVINDVETLQFRKTPKFEHDSESFCPACPDCKREGRVQNHPYSGDIVLPGLKPPSETGFPNDGFIG